MATWTKYLAVAAGSALGGMLRYYLGGTLLLARAAGPFPTATFVINVTGSFIVGFFLTLATERFHLSEHLKLAVAVGFVGAYTTFSTFEYETLKLAEEHGFRLALLNVFLSVVVGFAAVWGGVVLARQFAGVRATSSAEYEFSGTQADAPDPAQTAGAQRDIRDSTNEPPRDV